MTKSITRRNFVAGSAGLAALTALTGCNGAGSAPQADAAPAEGLPKLEDYPIDPDGGATLGVMDEAKIIQVGGLAFRDMNGNGKLDAWEDWRQDADFRSSALAASLTAEQCFPLMFAGGTQSDSTTTDTNAFDWIEQGSRAGVSRLASSINSYATDVEWINRVQETCEKSELGIPYLNYSDPYVLFDVPGSVGLSAAMDKDLWRKAGMWQARAWRATGVRCELGPQVDVYSNPIGTRTS